MEPVRAAATVRVAAAVVRRGDRVLLTQRPPGGPLGGLWEFPGGKLEPGESPHDAVIREIQEELGVNARTRGVLHVTRHVYAHGLDVEITFLECALDGEPLAGPGVHALRWERAADVDPDSVLEADREFLAALAQP